MKGYYIWAPLEEGCLGKGSGVEKKIKSQVNALRKCSDVCLKVIEPPKSNVLRKITRRLPFCAVNTEWKYSSDMDDADYIYIRQVVNDRSFIKYLRNLKKINKKVKILYEMPTYPYEDEQKMTISNCHILMKDRWNRLRLKEYIDRIVTFYGQKEILGIKTIQAKNGFDFASIDLPDNPIDQTIINVLEVSTTAFWHGYDRFLVGLKDYYNHNGKENVVFHMVGPILPDLELFVKNNNLEEHVVFHGVLSGEKLREVYCQCLAGIDILGGHRKNYPISSSLKSREYSAYGIPLITSSPVDFMESQYPYQLVVPYDDTPIDIKTVLNFIHDCYSDTNVNAVREKIRRYSFERCDMSVAMKPIIDYIFSGE